MCGGYVVGDLGGREGSGRGWDGGIGMGGRDRCLQGSGEGMRSGVVFAFLLCGLEGRGPCSFRGFFGFSFQVGISFNSSPKARVLLSQCLHLISTALFQVCQLLLHLRLAV